MVIEDRLTAIRGNVEPKRHTARTLAALTSNPGCARRAVLDAAGVDKEKVAQQVAFPTSIGRMSKLAVARGNSFEEQVKADGCAELLRLLREHLGLPVPEVHYLDLGAAEDSGVIGNRYRQTLHALARIAGPGSDSGTLFDHPLLRIQVGGVWAYLEPDLVAFRLGDLFYVIEIKSFPIIDGTADAGKVAAAARQSAAYVLAMQYLMEDNGLDPNLVSTEVVLVCPKDFSNQPTATLLDIRKPLGVLRRQLTRLDDIGDLLSTLPGDVDFDLSVDAHGEPVRSAEDLTQALSYIPARYAPECMNSCEMAKFCRHEARGSTAVLGRTVREDLGGVDSTSTVLALASGQITPSDDLQQTAQLLHTAWQMRNELLEA